MIRIPVPSFFSAVSLGNFWWNSSMFTALWMLAIFLLSPALMLVGIRMPWMPPYINIWYLFFGSPAGAYMIRFSYPFGVAAFNEFRVALAISQAHRVFFGIKGEPSGLLVGQIRAVTRAKGERVFDFRTNLQNSMSDEVFKLAKEMYDQKLTLAPEGTSRVETFSKQARKVIDLLELQKRDPIALEADISMIDKMVVDHLYLVSRLNQMETSSVARQSVEQELERLKKLPKIGAKEQDRIKILLGRLAQFQRRFELIEAAGHEVLAMEDRMSFIVDALCLHGHTAGFEERIYMPSPLVAELQALTWMSEA